MSEYLKRGMVAEELDRLVVAEEPAQGRDCIMKMRLHALQTLEVLRGHVDLLRLEEEFQDWRDLRNTFFKTLLEVGSRDLAFNSLSK